MDPIVGAVDPNIIGVVFGAFGTFALGAAALLKRKDDKEAGEGKREMDWESAVINAMQAHMRYISAENVEQRKEIREVRDSQRLCEEDKLKMSERLDAALKRISALEDKSSS